MRKKRTVAESFDNENAQFMEDVEFANELSNDVDCDNNNLENVESFENDLNNSEDFDSLENFNNLQEAEEGEYKQYKFRTVPKSFVPYYENDFFDEELDTELNKISLFSDEVMLLENGYEGCIEGGFYQEGRELFASKDLVVTGAEFCAHEELGEALIDSENCLIENSIFSMRSPLTNGYKLIISNCDFDELTQNTLSNSNKVYIQNSILEGNYSLEHCSKIHVHNTDVFGENFAGWTKKLKITQVSIEGKNAFTSCSNIAAFDLKVAGDNAFAYIKDALFVDCLINSDDAFKYAENVELRNCVIVGSRIGWYANNLTLIDCTIVGNEPLCRGDDINVIDCRMLLADLAFEYSAVNASIKGKVQSVINPLSGYIIADSIEDVYLGNAKCECTGLVYERILEEPVKPEVVKVKRKENKQSKEDKVVKSENDSVKENVEEKLKENKEFDIDDYLSHKSNVFDEIENFTATDVDNDVEQDDKLEEFYKNNAEALTSTNTEIADVEGNGKLELEKSTDKKVIKKTPKYEVEDYTEEAQKIWEQMQREKNDVVAKENKLNKKEKNSKRKNKKLLDSSIVEPISKDVLPTDGSNITETETSIQENTLNIDLVDNVDNLDQESNNEPSNSIDEVEGVQTLINSVHEAVERNRQSHGTKERKYKERKKYVSKDIQQASETDLESNNDTVLFTGDILEAPNLNEQVVLDGNELAKDNSDLDPNTNYVFEPILDGEPIAVSLIDLMSNSVDDSDFPSFGVWNESEEELYTSSSQDESLENSENRRRNNNRNKNYKNQDFNSKNKNVYRDKKDINNDKKNNQKRKNRFNKKNGNSLNNNSQIDNYLANSYYATGYTRSNTNDDSENN